MFLRLILCLTAVVLGVALRAQSTSTETADDELRIAERLRVLESESDRLTAEARALVADLRKLEAERSAQVSRMREAQAAIVESQTAIEGTAQRLLALEAQRLAQLPAMQTQLVDMYKRGRTGFARLVFSAAGIRELGRATRAAAAMLRVSQDRVLQHRATIEALKEERSRLETELAERRARETDARDAQAAVNKAVAERTAVLARIDSQRDVNARLAGELQVEQARLAQQQPPTASADRVPSPSVTVAAAPRPAAAPTTPPAPSAAGPSTAPPVTMPVIAPAEGSRSPTATRAPAAPPPLFGEAGPARGTLLWPVSGRVTARYGRRLATADNPAAANGVEIASREGNPVRTLHAGVVTSAGQQGGLGNVVVVDHGNNTVSIYGYLSSIVVTEGTRVTSGSRSGAHRRLPGRDRRPLSRNPNRRAFSRSRTMAETALSRLRQQPPARFGVFMTSRSRLLVLAISTPIIIFAFVGGYFGRAIAQDDTYQHLRVFEDVVSLVLNNYVEPVDIRDAMGGAMRGMADSLDPESAYLTPALVKSRESNDPGGPAEIGVDLTRQYYLRVVSARDGSPAARAGIRAGDFIRAIDNRPTRDMSAYEGSRLLRGAPGSKVSLLVIRGNAADPHVVDLVREPVAGSELTTRMANPTTGYVRIVEFSANSPARIREALDALAKSGATRYVIDLRGTSRGDLDEGIGAARLFVKSGTLGVRLGRADQKDPIASEATDGAIVAPLALLVDIGTAGAAEVFAAALDGNARADLIGTNTLGRAARQRLVKLPDQSGLWLTSQRYLTPAGMPIHETGLVPDVAVDLPEVEFGAPAPMPDEALQKALEHVAARPAA